MNSYRKSLRLLLFSLIIQFCGSACFASGDSLLRETLTRAIASWQAGDAKLAYLSLDSIDRTELSGNNAGTKARAAIWTATYLQAQKKIKPAARFLDSALAWSIRYQLPEEQIRGYEAYATWHLAAGNPKTALIAREAAWKIQDSIQSRAYVQQIDSLSATITRLEAKIGSYENGSLATAQAKDEQSAGQLRWVYILAGVCLVLLLIVFLLNGQLQKLKASPPAPAPTSKPAASKAAPVPAVNITDVSTPKETAKPVKTDSPPVVSEAPTPIEEPVKPPAPGALVHKLAEVELVLIKADILSRYNKGDAKSIRQLLNEYMAQLPFIMKSIDDTIGGNDAGAIVQALSHLKSYLHYFGMQGTLQLIQEIEDEASTEKVSKLLSRVFQVRNHCRRAADESKALLEKLS